MAQTKKETLEAMMKRIQKECQTIDVELEGTDLVGDRCGIFLEFDGDSWTARLGDSPGDTAHFCWMEDDDLKYDNTQWADYDSPIEALTALDEQCKKHKKHKAILVSAYQLEGE